MITEVLKIDPAEARDFFEQKVRFTTGPVEVNRKIEEDADINIVDVRAAEDFRQGHIPGAVNLPKDRWETMEGLSKHKVNVLYCYTQTCHLAATAAVEFADKGFPVMEMEGGFKTWKDSNLPIER